MFLLLLLLFMPRVYAQNYFDFAGRSSFLFPRNRMDIQLAYDINNLPEERFRFRVVSSKGLSRIVMDDMHFDSGNLWLQQPTIKKEIEIEVLGDFVVTEIGFEILDTKNHTLYSTPKKGFINFSIYKTYLERLNESFSKW